jgi:lysophospholipid acyltransferase (LPLAT)-like uncharacterized protein
MSTSSSESHSDQPQRRPRRRWNQITIRHVFASIGPAAIALLMVVLRWTCRVRMHNDPRAALRAAGVPYVYSVLHAQQLAAATCGHRGTAAMVSQSQDGALVALGLKLVGIIPIRGSNRRGGRDRGGLAALNNLIEHVRGGGPAYLAVDGPRGPRNRVHKGIAVLSRQANAAVLNVVIVPNRRWIIKRSWDRLQIPVPFCRIDTYFGDPLWPRAGETAESFRRRIEADLNELEKIYDPSEAALVDRSQLLGRERKTADSAAA